MTFPSWQNEKIAGRIVFPSPVFFSFFFRPLRQFVVNDHAKAPLPPSFFELRFSLFTGFANVIFFFFRAFVHCVKDSIVRLASFFSFFFSPCLQAPSTTPPLFSLAMIARVRARHGFLFSTSSGTAPLRIYGDQRDSFFFFFPFLFFDTVNDRKTTAARGIVFPFSPFQNLARIRRTSFFFLCSPWMRSRRPSPSFSPGAPIDCVQTHRLPFLSFRSSTPCRRDPHQRKTPFFLFLFPLWLFLPLQPLQGFLFLSEKKKAEEQRRRIFPSLSPHFPGELKCKRPPFFPLPREMGTAGVPKNFFPPPRYSAQDLHFFRCLSGSFSFFFLWQDGVVSDKCSGRFFSFFFFRSTSLTKTPMPYLSSPFSSLPLLKAAAGSSRLQTPRFPLPPPPWGDRAATTFSFSFSFFFSPSPGRWPMEGVRKRGLRLEQLLFFFSLKVHCPFFPGVRSMAIVVPSFFLSVNGLWHKKDLDAWADTTPPLPLPVSL